MKNFVRFACGLVLLAGLASCHGIGEGNTIQSLKIVFYPVSGEQGAYLTPENTASQPVPVTVPTLKMYDCFCSTVVVYGYFSDGTIGDVTSRATITSSDPATVDVAKFDTTKPCAFAQNDPLLWTLIPKQAGTATLTARFVGLAATLDVRVDDTASVLTNFGFVSADTAQTSPQVAVASNVRLLLQGMLNNDGITRTFNNNVHTDSTSTFWTLTGPAPDNADCTVPRFDLTAVPDSCLATLSKAALNGGVVAGFAPTGSTPVTVQAAFGSCPVTASQAVPVGDVTALTLAEEDHFYPSATGSDQLLAGNSNEILKVTGTIDLGGSTGTQSLGSFSSLASSDNCTLIDHDPDPAHDPGNTGTVCQAPHAATCANTVAVCPTITPTVCASTFSCRTDKPPIVPALLFTQITANAESSTNGPTLLTAQFPGGTLGTPTHLSAAVPASAPTVTVDVVVDALSGYPTTFPWFGVIAKGVAGEEEIVRVTAVSGTTLTVVRRSPSVNHAQGATFDPLSYRSDVQGTPSTLSLSAKAGTLTLMGLMDETNTNSLSSVTLTDSTTPAITSTGKAVQLQALGTYGDTATTDCTTLPAAGCRQQSVTHLTAANSGPAMSWSSSNTRVATVGPLTGLVTPNGICGGAAVIRGRATTSTSTTNNVFVPTITTTDNDGNGNDDANDTACLADDPLCDQVNLCIVTPATLPEGSLCAATTTYDSGSQKCVITCAAPATYNTTTGTCVTP